MHLTPLEAYPFEDFIDGYFPLSLSLQHMLDRRGFASAWLVFRVAPMMQFAGLGGGDPVPLHIHAENEGQIEWLAATVHRTDNSPIISGFAKWDWNEPSRNLSNILCSEIRLSEPAFVCGFGFVPGTVQTKTLGMIRSARNRSNVSIILPTSKSTESVIVADYNCWNLNPSSGVVRFHQKYLHQQTVSYGFELQERQEVLAFRNSNDPLEARILSDSFAF